MGVFLFSMLALYLVGFVFFAYFLVFADPETSKTADLLTRRTPEYLKTKLSRVIGKNNVDKLSLCSEHFLQIVYLVVVLGSWSIMFAYGYPWVAESKHVNSNHMYMGYFVFVACMMSWRYSSNVSPGYITARSLSKYDNYPYDNLLFVPNRICPTAGIPRLARSKYDRFSKLHVARFDHFCGWLHNPIGEENYRHFLLFLLVHVLMCCYGTYVTATLFWGEIVDKDLLGAVFFNVSTGAEVHADWFVVINFLFQRRFCMAGILLLMSVMSVLLGGFLGYHIWLTSRGMTTNESVKWGQVKKWHRHELQRYKQAIKLGIVPAASINVAAAPEPVDGPVGCTGATATDGDPNGTTEAPPIMDPGPFPENIYDVGFVENWKEVLFPRSLRPDALERWRKSLQDKGVQQKPNLPEPAKPKAS